MLGIHQSLGVTQLGSNENMLTKEDFKPGGYRDCHLFKCAFQRERVQETPEIEWEK